MSANTKRQLLDMSCQIQSLNLQSTSRCLLFFNFFKNKYASNALYIELNERDFGNAELSLNELDYVELNVAEWS
ncbi:hypothetical protein BpHYR1_049592 [Brachionus plicatilis]|uniref:Uncharacterized protein n=1 Tax=Brachionus plicatilis TaxID=10195 RepID=A0A3M7PK45_BRAPC|nr:hypothetical protein BpHYR1_049592 [Brachionus plicatilis]